MSKSRRSKTVSSEIKPGGKIKFKYLFNDDYHPEYVTGMFGGQTPRSEIVLNFFFERQGLPNTQTFSITEEGRLGDEESCEPADLHGSLVRQVKSGIIISKEVGRELRDFLDEILEEKSSEEGR